MIAQPRPPIAVVAEIPDFRKSRGKCHALSSIEEDRSQVRCGHIPQVMAAFRHTVIGLLRWAGYTNMAAACRRLAAQPARALALIGLALENCIALKPKKRGKLRRAFIIMAHGVAEMVHRENHGGYPPTGFPRDTYLIDVWLKSGRCLSTIAMHARWRSHVQAISRLDNTPTP